MPRAGDRPPSRGAVGEEECPFEARIVARARAGRSRASGRQGRGVEVGEVSLRGLDGRCSDGGKEKKSERAARGRRARALLRARGNFHFLVAKAVKAAPLARPLCPLLCRLVHQLSTRMSTVARSSQSRPSPSRFSRPQPVLMPSRSLSSSRCRPPLGTQQGSPDHGHPQGRQALEPQGKAIGALVVRQEHRPRGCWIRPLREACYGTHP